MARKSKPTAAQVADAPWLNPASAWFITFGKRGGLTYYVNGKKVKKARFERARDAWRAAYG